MTRALLPALALCLLGGAAVAGPAAEDGFIDAADVCSGGLDLSGQPETYRPYGGALLLPPGLSEGQRAAIRSAVSARYQASQGKAAWRLLDDDDGRSPVWAEAVTVASCGPGSPFGVGSWAHAKPAGGVGVHWAFYATPEALSTALAARLKALEGDIEE